MRGAFRRTTSTRSSICAVVITCASLAAGTLLAPTAHGAPLDERKKAAVAELRAGKPAPRPAVGSAGRDVTSVKNALGRAQSENPVLVVQTDSSASAKSVAAVAKRDRIAVRHQFTALHTVSVQVPAGKVKQTIAALTKESGVTSVKIATPRHVFALPDDPDFADHQSSYLNSVHAPAAWDLQNGSPEVKIAVIDTGVDTSHPDLSGKVVGQYNALDGSSDVTDTLGHGTFVAGVAAAATNNGVGATGAGFNSSVLAVKVADPDGSIYDDAEAAGIIWATDNGARIINLSFGGTNSSDLEKSAIDYAAGKGVLIVAAAGNDGADGNPTFYPAAYPNVLAVGATDGASRAYFSEYGAWVDVAAPGVSIYSTTPRVKSDLFAPSYDTADGTSFSAPLVAGEAALLIAAAPGITAADLRTAVVGSASGFAGFGLGAGRVDFRGAFDHVRPTSAPQITAPANGGIVTGSVVLSARATAPKVHFQVDGSWLGSPVAAVGGVATATWSTWGLPNGRHVITGVQCSAAGIECGGVASTVSVTVGNGAPVVTAPKAGATVGGAFTVTALSPGGGLAFYIDGFKRGFDAAAPYSLAYSGSALADGAHSVWAVQCSVSGAACSGPTSPHITFTAKSLHPVIIAVSPSTFSPNGDKRNDVTTVTYRLAGAEAVAVSVINSAGATVRGPLNGGTLAAGNHIWTWNGRGNAGQRIADGLYTVQISTSKVVGGVLLRGLSTRAVRIDTAPPRMTSISADGGFYPRPDGYRDTFTSSVILGEAGRLTLNIRNARGLVRSITAGKPAGRQSLAWNGRNSANAIVPSGVYTWTLTAVDAAGNTLVSAPHQVTVSLRALVAKTAVLVRNGADATSFGGSDPSCAVADKSRSDFSPRGIWLLNVCDPATGDLAAAFYSFTLPAAAQYRSMRLDTYGNTIDAPSRVRGTFRNSATGQFDLTAGTNVYSAGNAWYTMGSVSPTPHYDVQRHTVQAGIFVTNDSGNGSDFDIGQVRLVVNYTVLV